MLMVVSVLTFLSAGEVLFGCSCSFFWTVAEKKGSEILQRMRMRMRMTMRVFVSRRNLSER